MKHLHLLFTLLLVTLLTGSAFADSCASCPSHSAKKVEATCEDGVCGDTEPAKADHKHEEPKPEEKNSAATLNTSALKTLMDTGIPLVILDARSGQWDDGTRIPGALSLNAESKAEEIAKIIPTKESLVVTYCSNLKCPASDMLYKHLKSLGYTNVIEYPEGIQGWKEAGHQVKSVK